MKTVAKMILVLLISPLLWAGAPAAERQETDRPPLAPGKPIDYTRFAIQPRSWKSRGLSLELTPWEGKKVVFLTTDAKLDHGLMGIWVSRLDEGWQLYADLTGRSPGAFHQINGKPTIAAVPTAAVTCGAGCGYIGVTGIELAMFYDANYPQLRARPNSMPHYAFYEMGRNYYTFGDRHSCFITGFAVFMRYVCMDTLKCEDPEAGLRKTIEGVERRFAKSKLSFLDLFTNTTWKNEKAGRIKDDAGYDIEPSDQPVCYAAAMLRLRRENGGNAWVKRFFQYLATCPESDQATEAGALKQGLHWLISASLAARKDLSGVFADDWHYPLTAAQRDVLRTTNWQEAGLTVAKVDNALAAAKKSASEENAPAPRLVPQPKTLTRGEGVLRLGASSPIVAADPELAPLAAILAEEIHRTTGVALAPGGAASGEHGRIVLRLDPALKGESYTLNIDDGDATVSGGNYPSVAAGTATLLQLIGRAGAAGGLVVPKLAIVDEPRYWYRAAMIDLARKYHTPQGVEQVIELCRLYKIRYLHLHLSDDHLFMFPSTRFPQLGRSNVEFARFEPPSKLHIAPYTLDELRGLEKFARERGVYLVPEIDLPGHSGRLIADARDTFGFAGNGSTVNIASPKTVAALTALLNEVMDVFQSTPVIHLGADEVGLYGLDATPEYKAAQARDGVKSVHEMYCKFIADMQEVVRKRGKRAIVWEEAWSPRAKFPLAKDALVMEWTMGRDPRAIVKSGYSVINASWTPFYIVRENKRAAEFLFNWSLLHFGRNGSSGFTALTDSDGLAGAEICSWENSENIEIQSMRDRLAVLAERAWNPRADGDFAAFQSRRAHTDALLESLVHPIAIHAGGPFVHDENTFNQPFQLTLAPKEPAGGVTIKYTLDNSLPNDKWRVYRGPITIDKTVHLRAGLFDERGAQQGYLVGGWFKSAIVPHPNLATGKPVTVGPDPSIRDENAPPEFAVDGKSDDPGKHWNSLVAAPQWLQVDLGKVQPVNFINVITYWDGSRYYQLNAEVSMDGKAWTKVLDFSKNTAIATANGYSGKFPETKARYVRVNMLKNSANPFVHIVELIVDKK